MNLERLKSIFSANGCSTIYIKVLAKNDLSKSQVYFSGSFDILNILPLTKIESDTPTNWKASINFWWIDNDGEIHHAPKSKFILYPQYPEGRFSGFLFGCDHAPSEIMNSKVANRLLFFSVGYNGKVFGYATSPDSLLFREFCSLENLENYGVFKVIQLPLVQNNREKLLIELLRIHRLGWIKSKRLNSLGEILPCDSPNCGGYTLEAELGITPNGYSEPDYLGWEVKQFGVENFNRLTSKVITLMTPEPTHGFYKTEGAEAFIRKYGYADMNGKPDRLNFGGIHKIGITHPKTKLTLKLSGYNADENKIVDTNGSIVLLDSNERETASWSFSSMLLHWNRKHNQACYVPSLTSKADHQQYMFGKNVILGNGTDFQMFLMQMAAGNIYYDPGIKLENMSTKPSIKKRSQFRIISKNLRSLYKNSELVDVTEILD